MKLLCDGFRDNAPLPERFAYGVADGQGRVAAGENLNPGFSWAGQPDGVRSLVLSCHDPDVPSQVEVVNREGLTVPAGLPRVDFYHWLLVDIPPETEEIEEGSYAHGIVPGGKAGPEAHDGTRQGINDFSTWFAGDPDLAGDYYGYDGPCPPWNDERLHHYIFTLYALDTDRCPVAGRFDGRDVLRAISGHILASGSVTGTYTLNPLLRG